jgi:hypothetical protein
LAAWLGIAGIGVQSVLPVLLAFAVSTATCAEGASAFGVSAIHPDHASHHVPRPPSQHRHTPAHCTLCQTLQGAGTATLPASLALSLPTDSMRAAAFESPAALALRGSPAAYISRAPPPIV